MSTLTIAELRVRIAADTSSLDATMREIPTRMRAGLQSASTEAQAIARDASTQAAAINRSFLDEAMSAGKAATLNAASANRSILEDANIALRAANKDYVATVRDSEALVRQFVSDTAFMTKAAARDKAEAEKKASAEIVAANRAVAESEAQRVAVAREGNALLASSERSRIAALTAVRDQELANLNARMAGWQREISEHDASLTQVQPQHGARGEALRSVAGSVGTGMANMAAGITLVEGAVAKLGSGFESSMLDIQNNTTMTAAQADKMRETILRLGKEGGVSFDELGKGFLHAFSLTNDMASATNILDIAMKSAVATGASTEDVTNVLAKAMKDFNLPAKEAAHTMDILHLAAAEGNVTLQQFSEAAGPVLSTAANMGVKLQDVAAAFVALTRHGYNADEAATQIAGTLVHLVQVSKPAQQALEFLSKKTGVDLVGDFSLAGLHAKGFAQILQDLNKATDGHVGMVLKLIPALRGGRGAMALAGNAAGDLTGALKTFDDVTSNKIHPTLDGFALRIGTAATQFSIMQREIESELIPEYKKLKPMLEEGIKDFATLGHGVVAVVKVFDDLPEPIRKVILAIGGIRIATLALGPVLGLGAVAPMAIKLINGIRDAWVGVEAAEVAAGGAAATAATGGLAAKSAILATVVKASPFILGALATGDRNQAVDTDRYSEHLKDPFLQKLADILGSKGVTEATAYAEKNRRFWERADLATEQIGDAQQILKIRRQIADDDGRAGMERGRWAASDVMRSQQPGSEIGIQILKHATDGLKTPEGQASCAFFATEVMRAAGAAIPKMGSAKGLRDYLSGHGAEAHDLQGAKAGDVIIYRGSGYGESKFNEGGQSVGYHAAIALGGGMQRSSSGGKARTSAITDFMHGTAFTVPDSMKGLAAMPGGVNGESGDIEAQLNAFIKPKAKLTEAQKQLRQFGAAMKSARAEGTELHATLLKVNQGMADQGTIAAQVAKDHANWTVAQRNALVVQLEKNKGTKAEITDHQWMHDHLQEIYAKQHELRMKEVTGVAAVMAAHKGLSKADAELLVNADKSLKSDQARTDQYQELNKALAETKARTADLMSGGTGAATKNLFSSIAPDDKTLKQLAEAKFQLEGVDAALDKFKARADARLKFKAVSDESAAQVKVARARLSEAQGDPLAMLRHDNPLASNDGLRGVLFNQETTKAIDAQRTAIGNYNLKLRDMRAELSDLTTHSKGSGAMGAAAGTGGAGVFGSIVTAYNASVVRDLAGQIQDAKAAAKSQDDEKNALSRLGEAIADQHAKVRSITGVTNQYSDALAHLNLATKNVTPEMKHMVDEWVRNEKEISKIDKMKQSAQELTGVFMNTFGHVKEGFKGMWDAGLAGFEGMLIKMANEMVASKLEGAIFQGLSSIFGGGKGGGTQGLVSGGDQNFAGYFADGGSVMGGRPIMVGERGPELFVPHRSGSIVPNNQIGGTKHVTQVFNITTPDVAGFRQSQGQIMADARRAMARA